MEDYPAHYVEHNLPLVALFGIGRRDEDEFRAAERSYPLLEDRGIYIASEVPNVPGDVADDLFGGFQEFDARDASWSGRPGKGKMGTMGFTFRAVGRALTLPTRKALMPPGVEIPDEEEGPRRPSWAPVLHSPISPLTLGSPLFPDGVLTPLWFSKHQRLLPSALISFYAFTVNESSSTLQDNKLKTEINALKTSMASSTYRCRLVVVLVAESDSSFATTAERLGNIRRSTSLDAKSLFLLPEGLAAVELRAFIGTILASLQPTCIEYYRDLSKHARRKKNRGATPPPTVPPTQGTSQTLSTQGWNVRYEVKLGAFAEFRQEMDAAGHSYEGAYENLVDSDIIESVPNWSPRFDEARLLADVLAIRIMRCLLWTGQTTSAVQSWTNHRLRMQELVNQKGKGSTTYGWQAWEARWSSVMARLIEKVDLPIFHVPDSFISGDETVQAPDIYAIPEKAFANEVRLPPWDLLHHEGYWLWRSCRHTRARRRLAMGIPKEDRNSPGNSPASAVASKAHLYDTFLCPEPHREYGLPGKESFDHSALLIETLEKATHHFAIRRQARFSERTTFETARELMKSGRWADALAMIKPLWLDLSWRRTGWWHLLEEVTWAVRACARNWSDGETLVAAEWELLSSRLTPRKNWTYDFSKCLDNLDFEETPHAFIDSAALAPCLATTFTFGSATGNVGIALPAQLKTSLQIHDHAAAITFPELVLFFEGGLQPIRIFHDETLESMPIDSKGRIAFFDVELQENVDAVQTPKDASAKLPELHGRANLSFSPKKSKVLSFSAIPRIAGVLRATRFSLAVRHELFTAEINVPIRERAGSVEWWLREDGELLKGQLHFEHQCSLEIKSKPPKLKVELPSLHTAYYTDEHVELDIVLENEEEDEVDVTLFAQVAGTTDRTPPLTWAAQQLHEASEAPGALESPSASEVSARRLVGKLQPSEKRHESISIQALSQMAEYALELRADYTLASDPGTTVTKTVQKRLSFIGPFEASCDFAPRVDHEPWPDYFSLSSTGVDSSDPQGLSQKWTLATKIASFGVEPLVIERAVLNIIESKPGAICKVHQPRGRDSAETTIEPNEMIDRAFDISVQKSSLEDRLTSVVSFQLDIFWRRLGNGPASTLPQDEIADASEPSATSPQENNSPNSPNPPVPQTAGAKPPTTKASLLIPSLSAPFGEPRVLASARPSTALSPPLIHLTYVIENPSTHVLAFRATMEASDEFAFSGPKSVSLTLVPLDRAVLRFNLLPTRQGVWMRPVLKVLDVGFGKVLRVWAAEGCRSDRRGLMVWAEAE